MRTPILPRKEINMAIAPESRSEQVDLRMTPSARQILQQAASVTNTTVTEFLLHSGLHAAYDALADRRTFMLDQSRWDEFTAALDAPPADNPRLRDLLARKPAWEP
jgi:uncharacterized protein (DUF1778 family)